MNTKLVPLTEQETNDLRKLLKAVDAGTLVDPREALRALADDTARLLYDNERMNRRLELQENRHAERRRANERLKNERNALRHRVNELEREPAHA